MEITGWTAYLRLIVSIPLAGIFLYVSLGNASFILRGFFTGRGPSLLPLVGGVCGTLAVLAFPREGLIPWAWIPLVLDPGTLVLLLAPLALLRRRPPGPGPPPGHDEPRA